MRKLTPFCTLIAIAALACPVASLQAEEPAVPLSSIHEVMDDSLIDHVTMPRVNVDALLAEDAYKAATASGIPYRVAEPLESRITIKGAGTIETLDDGSRLWRVRVTSPGAEFLSFSFSNFRLPRGAQLNFYSVGRDHQSGPFTARQNNDLEVFGSPAIAGDSAVIELFLPPGRMPWPAFVIDEISHGYRDFLGFSRIETFGRGRELPTDKHLPCIVEINCPEGFGWENDKNAVARIYDGRYVCTGTMITNQRRDCTNYFLTANHCVNKKKTAQKLTFYWNFERPGCVSGSVPFDHTSSGSNLIVNNGTTDFSLLELYYDPDPAYNVYYAGFDRSSSPPSAGTCIHHPGGEWKMINHEYDPVEDGADFWDGYGGDHWRVVGWDVGATEGGSSGSGLWNPNHELVGQLHGSTSDCSGGWDEYGKLSKSWTDGLAAYLDPDNTGVMSVAGHFATGACYPGCGSDAECDDSNVCTTDVCNAGVCENGPVPESTDCAGGICCGGTCEPIVCSDEKPCPENTLCTDLNCAFGGTCAAYCVFDDWPDGTSCGAEGICCSGMCDSPECLDDAACDDGDDCTVDSCPGAGTCDAACSSTLDENDPSCVCGAKNDPCISNSDCCSNRCRKRVCR